MPSSSSLTTPEKSTVKKAVPASSNKILAAAICRIYYAFPDSQRWSYSGLSGALVFGRSMRGAGIAGSFWFRLVDLDRNQGVVWEHELFEDGQVEGSPGQGNFPYSQDRSFWHTFQGDECPIGFAFANESEASNIYLKVSNRAKNAGKSKNPKITEGVSTSPLKQKKGAIDKSAISSPSSFKHVAHMGYDSERGFTAENIDPSWERLISQLSNLGISRVEIESNKEFIKDYVAQSGVLSKPVALRPAAPATLPTLKRKKPPPPPTPAPRRIGSSQPAETPARLLMDTESQRSAVSIGLPSARPPPEATTTPEPRAPPPQPLPSTTAPPAPPPPPPPPPPPTIPAAASPSSLTVQTESTKPMVPIMNNARSELLASIQGKGVHNLRKTETQSHAIDRPVSMSSSTEGGLASSLAAALNKRKGTMGDSSDEDASDEEW